MAYSFRLPKQPVTAEGSTRKKLQNEDDFTPYKIFKDDDLHVSVSLAPIDVKDHKIAFSFETNERKILEIEDDERLVSDIISVSGTLPRVLTVPALLKILCSVQLSELDANTEIVLKYYNAARKNWQIQENVDVQGQEYGNSIIPFLRKVWIMFYLCMLPNSLKFRLLSFEFL